VGPETGRVAFLTFPMEPNPASISPASISVDRIHLNRIGYGINPLLNHLWEGVETEGVAWKPPRDTEVE
jgi:hypothetical protein